MSTPVHSSPLSQQKQGFQLKNSPRKSIRTHHYLQPSGGYNGGYVSIPTYTSGGYFWSWTWLALQAK